MNKNIRSLSKTILLIAIAPAILFACAVSPMKHEIADRVAHPAWMVKRTIPAAPFSLTAYERMHTRHAPANIYIEGDGKAWLSRTKISRDPTPTNPVALHVSAYDDAENVAWLARPCQYSKMLKENTRCPNTYWTNKRFAPEVLESYNKALDNIAAKYDITTFNLIGFSGGANVAAILAATRNDVVSLRTIAGNLNHVAHSRHHQVSPLNGSLNAMNYTDQLKTIPQHHFIGGQDENVTPKIIQSYLQALGTTPCAKYTIIPENEHTKGWTQKWPELLEIPMSCKKSTDKNEMDYIPTSMHLDMPMVPQRILPEMPEKP